MSDIGGRHSSKWDVPEGNKSPKDLYDSGRTSRMRSSFHDRDAPRRHLPNGADISVHSRQTSLGREDFQMDETIDGRSLSRDRDGKRTARISPGRDEWRQRNRCRSPRDKIRSHRSSISRSRSRSCSPGNGYCHEQIERSRNRIGAPPQLCRDFAAGRCKRGNHCPFSHSDQSYDRRHSESSVADDFESRHKNTSVSKYSSTSSRYAHYEASSDRKGSMDVLVEDGDNDRRRRGNQRGWGDDNDTVKDRDDDRKRNTSQPGWSNDREEARTGEMICKYFAAGRCRHGKYCRMSHNLQEVAHPNGALDAARASHHNFDGANQAWKGASWDDPMPDVARSKGWLEDKKEILDVTKSGEIALMSRDEPRVPRNNRDSVSKVWQEAPWDDTVVDVSPAKGGPEGKRENFHTMRPTQRSQVPRNNLERANEVWQGATWVDTMGDVSQAKGWPEEKREMLDSMQPQVSQLHKHNMESVSEACQGATWEDNVGDASLAREGWPEVKIESSDARNPSQMSQVPNHNSDVSKEWQGTTWDDTNGNVSQEKGWLERKDENVDRMKPIQRSMPGSHSQDMDFVSKGYTVGGEPAGGEPVSHDGTLPHEWKPQDTVNEVSVSNGTENCFSYVGNLASGSFVQQGPQISRLESVPLSHTYVHTRQLEVPQYPRIEKQYATADSQPGAFDQPYSKMPTTTVGVSSAYPSEYTYRSSYTSSNTSTDILPGQGSAYTSNASTISGLNAVGVGQPAASLGPSSESIHVSQNLLNLGGKLSDAPYTGDGNLPQHAPSQSPVIPELLLAQLIEKDLFSKLYAAQQGTSGSISSVPNSTSSEKLPESSQAQKPVTNMQVSLPYAATNSYGTVEGHSTVHDSNASVHYLSTSDFQAAEKQYDPLSDSVDTKLPNMDAQVGTNSPIPGTSTVSAPGVEPVALTITATGADDDLAQAPAAVTVDKNGSPIVAKDDPVDKGTTDVMAIDDGTDDGKKGKDAKGLRAFKFALAEFIKELLKPTWKEGRFSKEVYKTIVKKVVNKVLDTVQAAHIPQTKEKIDHYLSLSKPKLSKLVQAYVGKYQKS